MSHFDYICVYRYGSTADPHCGTYTWISGDNSDYTAVYSNGTYSISAVECAGIKHYYIDPASPCTGNYWATGCDALIGTWTKDGAYQCTSEEGICEQVLSSSSSHSFAECASSYVVTGTVSPDVTGTYTLCGDYLDHPLYCRGEYRLYWYSNAWWIGTSGYAGLFKNNTNDLCPIEGNYPAEPKRATGTAIVNEEELSSSSSASTASSQSQSSESSSSTASSQSESSTSSPSSVSSESSENVWNLIGYLVVEINGSTSKNHFLPLYSHSTEGYTESDRVFWGCIFTAGELSNLAEDGFLSTTINSNPYWLHIYTADAVECDCCTNLQGTWRPV